MNSRCLKYFAFLLTITCLIHCESPPSDTERESIEQERPNILFIEVDDLTAKYISAFGGDFSKTPCLDELAASGKVFENAVVQGVMCTPSRNSLVTTKYPHELGLYENLDLTHIPRGTWTFPQALKDQGYHTMWVGKNHLIPDARGVGASNRVEMRVRGMQREMGFEYVYESLGRAMLIQIMKQKCNTMEGWPSDFDSYGDFLYENDLMDTFVQEGNVTATSLNENFEYMDGHFTTHALNLLEGYREDRPFSCG